MIKYHDEASYRRRLENDARLPLGFRTSRTTLDFIPREKTSSGKFRMNLGLIRLDRCSESFAVVFTKNAFPGFPVLMGRKLLEQPVIRGILVNNQIANVGVAEGEKTVLSLMQSLKELTGDIEPYFPSSTGIIGWKLPYKEMVRALPDLVAGLQGHSALPLSEAIMTTDAWPKVRSQPCGEGRITGIVKGAGMVEPHLATMLAFLMTDVALPREAGRRLLSEVCDTTFNRISVDGCSSTSDAVYLFASGQRPYPGDEVFTESLRKVAGSLAEDVVRNGEGTSHVMRLTVSRVGDSLIAEKLARSVANSLLVKTALRGNDPNVGRILQALGAQVELSGICLDPRKLKITVGSETVYNNGEFSLNADKEEKLHDYLISMELPVPAKTWPTHEGRVEIHIEGERDGPSITILASDLSEEYVKINADYRT